MLKRQDTDLNMNVSAVEKQLYLSEAFIFNGEIPIPYCGLLNPTYHGNIYIKFCIPVSPVFRRCFLDVLLFSQICPRHSKHYKPN